MSQDDVPSALNVPLHVPFPVRPFSLPVPPANVQVHRAPTGALSLSVVAPSNRTKYLSPPATLPTPSPRSRDMLPLISEVNVSTSSFGRSPAMSPCDQVHCCIPSDITWLAWSPTG